MVNYTSSSESIRSGKQFRVIKLPRVVADSKVNSLNEFKKQRTQLTDKFLKQEDELCKTKAEKDNLAYETEKKLIVAKEQ